MEESKRLRGEGGRIKFIDLRFENGKVLEFRGRKKIAICSVKCVFLGRMMICRIHFVD